MNGSTYQRLRETAAVVAARRAAPSPRIGVVLGSGLGAFAETLSASTVIPFADLPYFPPPTVVGHAGNLVLGRAGAVEVAVLQGRAHLYEGRGFDEVVYPIRLLGCLGARQLVITNAAGGIDTTFVPGDLMLITDHLNLTGGNPLVGPNVPELGSRFPDMSDTYTARLREIALGVAARCGIALRQGVYAGLVGPSFETPAEIRMLRALGAQAVGMSTVAEVIAAGHLGMEVLGISCITNMAAGILPRSLTHQEVLDTTERVRERFVSLLAGVIPALPAPEGRA